MGYKQDGEWHWEYPAHVVTVYDGASFLADLDLGFDVHVRAIVVADGLEVEPIETRRGLMARKEAQRLLHDADLVLHVKEVTARGGRVACLADVAYSPWHLPRSDQASFVAAMLAGGHVAKAA